MSKNKHKLKPVYPLQEITSSEQKETWENLAVIGKAIGEGWIILWQHHRVFTGQIKGGIIYWLPKNSQKPETGNDHFVRLRAFNKWSEYHFWNTNDGIKGRSRMDSPGEGTECIDTQMLLRGVVADPLKTGAITLNKDESIAILTRNYIGYHPDTQQAGYIDSRFVDFTKRQTI